MGALLAPTVCRAAPTSVPTQTVQAARPRLHLPVRSSLLSRPEDLLIRAFSTGFLTGTPFTATFILLPTRYQLVQGLSPLAAGLRMLPFLLSSALGSGLGGAFTRFHFGPALAVIAGNVLVVIGLGLTTTLGDEQVIETKQYGFLVILGLGFGMGLSSLIVVARTAVGPADSAILMASLTQVRVLGGCVGLAVANALVSGRATVVLRDVLTLEQA
jgi:hypothetical protein